MTALTRSGIGQELGKCHRIGTEKREMKFGEHCPEDLFRGDYGRWSRHPTLDL
jgi:hypothetical protein